MQLENIIHESHSYLKGSKWMLQWNKMGILGKFVHYQDAVKMMG
jgi:hypothetical protein